MGKLSVVMLLFSCLLVACKSNSSNHNLPQKSIAAEVDSSFDVFLKKFNEDATFQMSRVRFPMVVTELDDAYEPVNKIVTADTYEIQDFSYDPALAKRELDAYTQTIVKENNKAVIEVRGVDNGIMFDAFFEKINGKWFLINCDDSST